FLEPVLGLIFPAGV
nr:pollen allergen Lol p IV - perennial ryegrass (fragments) [Lolium perenne]